jgi:hypothetical protein
MWHLPFEYCNKSTYGAIEMATIHLWTRQMIVLRREQLGRSCARLLQGLLPSYSIPQPACQRITIKEESILAK